MAGDSHTHHAVRHLAGAPGAHRLTAVRSATAGARNIKLSILMPAYNEQATIGSAIAAVLDTEYPCDVELIVVDDGSSDATGSILQRVDDPRAVIVTHAQNRGKGAALQTAARHATGTHLVPFDADFEYDPADLVAMLRPVIQRRCDVVYGTRLLGANTRYQSYRHALGNRALTIAANVLFDVCLSDLHTCLKLVPTHLFRELDLAERGFGLDTEITAKLLRCGIKPFEVPVSYHSRSFAAGKKITWRDGVECLQILARVRSGRTRIADSLTEAPEMWPVGPEPQAVRRSMAAPAAVHERPAAAALAHVG